MEPGKSDQYYFEYFEKAYTFPRSLLNVPKRDWVRRILNGLKPGSKILDAGCGGGDITRPLAGKYNLTGVDIEARSVEYCRRQAPRGGKARYVRADLAKMPLPSNHFDAVVFCNAIEHLFDPDPVVKELARVLKPGGILLCTTENCESWLWVFLENTWYRVFGGNCKPYKREVHPQRFTPPTFRACVGKFLKVTELFIAIKGIEMFMVATKGPRPPKIPLFRP
jgi:ubiquinone/menaquinone biosynthesis C-methylase UbiE